MVAVKTEVFEARWSLMMRTKEMGGTINRGQSDLLPEYAYMNSLSAGYCDFCG